jgi:hypothetical protein
MRRLALLVLVGLAGCVTPSIPIPPPDPAAMTFNVTTDAGGAIASASLEYPPTDTYKGGLVYVFNRSIGHGIIELVKPDGSIGPTTPVEATAGHALVITVENDDQTVSTCITLRADATAQNFCP